MGSTVTVCLSQSLADIGANAGFERAFLALRNIVAANHGLPAPIGAAEKGRSGSFRIPQFLVNRARPEAAA